MDHELNEEQLQDLYAWIDQIPLSRPKKHITRDFSDGVMAAEVVKHFFPKIVELHNYSPANSTQQKMSNWSILNRKVFSKLDFDVGEERIKKIALRTAGVIEPVLFSLREKIDLKLEQVTENTLELEYHNVNNIKNQETLPPETHVLEALIQAQMKAVEGSKRIQRFPVNGSKPKALERDVTEMDPALRLMLQEKERAVMTLQETVEILQMKVNRLEHLVHLKDVRIGDLTRHLDSYKAQARPGRP
ncbi:sperm flagellar protein 1 [Gadus morhua]|uniref:sperm flagellar protein 1 n=1 Tax=Gadus morhua TaxID=8049 RepID=UPI0011B6B4E0|nr:sperm flagellar protein 1 [Gadus morhua]